MRVRLLKHWNGFRPGRVFAAMPDGAGNVLIDRKLAEPAEAPKKPANRRKARGKATKAARKG